MVDQATPMRCISHPTIALGSCALAALAILLLGQQLPPRVASHFNAAGVPDSFMPRGEFVTLMVVFGNLDFVEGAHLHEPFQRTT